MTATHLAERLTALVEIHRPDGQIESLPLLPLADDRQAFQSETTPAEPHEFDAILKLSVGEKQDILPFRMEEPEGDHH